MSWIAQALLPSGCCFMAGFVAGWVVTRILFKQELANLADDLLRRSAKVYPLQPQTGHSPKDYLS